MNFAVFILQQEVSKDDFDEFLKLLKAAEGDARKAVEDNPRGYEMALYYQKIHEKVLLIDGKDLVDESKKEDNIRKVESWMEEEKPRSSIKAIEAIQAGEYGKIKSGGEAHEL